MTKFGTETLEPCPFCGSPMSMGYDAKSKMFGPDGDHRKACILRSWDFRDYIDAGQALAAWNCRA